MCIRDRHWTLAEAINTSAVLYHVTGREKYAKDYAEFMKYLYEVVMDHENGSWFHQLDEHNHLKGTVWPGKSDLYHALQSTLIPVSYTHLVQVPKAFSADGRIDFRNFSGLCLPISFTERPYTTICLLYTSRCV